MKVLLVNVVCGRGSTGRIVMDLYNAIESSGNKAIVAFGRGENNSEVNSYKISNKIDTYIHALKSRINDNAGFESKGVTTKFIDYIEKEKPDLIHLHNIHGYYINVDILFEFLQKKNIPIVWTLHDCWPFTGHCCYFDYINCKKWETQCFDCEQKREYPQSLIFDKSRINYNKKKGIFSEISNLNLVTVSSWLKDTAKKSFLADKDITVISNGIDQKIFKPTFNNKIRKKYKIGNKKIVLGVANVWDRRKGLMDFLKLSDMLSDEYIIILVGLNTKQIKNLPQNIIGIERTNNIYELVELYSESEVFLNTSVEETFGMVTAEAMACGTPVIVYNCTANPELVEDGCGYVVEKSNLEAVVDSIRLISKNGKDKYSDKCVNNIEKKYNKEDICNKYIELYKNIINKKL